MTNAGNFLLGSSMSENRSKAVLVALLLSVIAFLFDGFVAGYVFLSGLLFFAVLLLLALFKICRNTAKGLFVICIDGVDRVPDNTATATQSLLGGGCKLLVLGDLLGKLTVRHIQYSCGNNNVVELRSASVMIQSRSLRFNW